MTSLPLLLALVLPAVADPPGFPKFTTQEIDAGLKIGYAVILEDIDGDKKKDIVVVDQHKVVWYQNPTWKKRVILDGKTKPDNVCITALDIDGGGDLELVVGAGWKPMDTANPGTLQWLKRGKTLDEEWTLHPIPCDEPTVHRIGVRPYLGMEDHMLILAPLMGRGATAKGNWTDGRPVRLMGYDIPKKPTDPKEWKPVVLNESLNVIHNFTPGGEWCLFPTNIYLASYEGVSELSRPGDKWVLTRLHEADQRNPKGNRGASEIATGGSIATIEPWHGNQVVLYTPHDDEKGKTTYKRHVLDDKLRWGHAVKLANLSGEEGRREDVIAGVRDDPNPKLGDNFTERRGVRLYRSTDDKGEKWDRFLLDPGGVAVEDLAVADLDGDDRVDIVAVGRQTGNCRIYWNKGK